MGITPQHAAAEPPRLVVVLVVDQMRADYIDLYQHQWHSGLTRLLRDGAWFRRAAYPYLNTVTCAGHATISTGTFPAQHGMVHNEWWDREHTTLVQCAADDEHPVLSYGRPMDGGVSARRLSATTLSDELRAQLPNPSRVVALSLKARSTAMLAGQTADVALWFDDRGSWVTSTAFADAPVAFVQSFIDAHPVEADANETWTRTLPTADYLFEDDLPFERPGAGWSATFPHPLSDDGSASPDFFLRWQQTPRSDQYLARLAETAVDTLGLGQGPGTDYLAISFSALDKAGHKFGPRSHEVQDLLVRLDATIGSLLEQLDRTLGPERYVVALSADHGVAPIPEAAATSGLNAGRIQTKQIGRRVDRALSRILGQASSVASVHYPDIYFKSGVYNRIIGNPPALRAVTDALLASPGVWRILRSDQLDSRKTRDDPVARAASLSHYPSRSGDIKLISRPYWITSSNATTHGTHNDYDQRVPMIFLGAGIEPGQYLGPATPADIAPTLAFLTGVTLAHADGRVLAEALRRDAP
jgi:predicted AlkP superfamily pyrophosphatase or phosphodiesterase